jgi:hypothetical protein
MIILTTVLIIANISGNLIQLQEKPTGQIDLNTIIIASIAAGAVLVSIYFGWRQTRHGNFQRLIEVYKMINDPEGREARKNIYNAYRTYYKRYFDDWDGDLEHEWKTYTSENIRVGSVYADIFTDEEVLNELNIEKDKLIQDVESVRATFDHIGALVKNKLVPKKPLLDALWGTARTCWVCLRDNIMIERDKRETEFYMDFFQYLFNEIEDYIDDNNLRHVTPYRDT